jgi:hypothetical protein
MINSFSIASAYPGMSLVDERPIPPFSEVILPLQRQ